MTDTPKAHPMNWQPIETAPKDGTPVLLWLDPPLHSNDCWSWIPFGEICVVTGWTTDTEYRDGSYEWNCGFCRESSADSYGYTFPLQIDVTPTHWMPLPTPP
ncbi:hypothetical protein UFOVP1204_66 [uncultured Caudovirales phage]|uniref:DUF551 domain-containing protein n=1 Tax=uncultured Caudovirales phage TaxID=2100421 RepID=A0A6J5Q4Y7_9CAUD|nr:hypothetical protein UFOVP473_35 [uncultured Caudovirales phage]CAB4176551.1 hypothetical protein UFOVP983_35 [uncultured Caudovirales phage]CAB4190384.1 hypothetical protein UFOVP1204_66 [uncultured Caudovirales phage]